MNTKIIIITALMILTLLTFIFEDAFAENENSKSIRIGFFPNITHSQALVGKASGKIEKELALPVKWLKFNAGPSEVEALMAGEIDLGYIGPGPAINGYAKTKGDLQIIAGATNAGAILVSRKDVNIKNVSQLTGKKIAIPQYGNTQDLSLRHLLKINNLKDTTKGGTVTIIQADSADIKVLFAQKVIDAALVPEPWGSRLIKETGAKVVLDYKQIWRNGNYPSAVVIARTDFINKHPEIVKKFVKAHIDLTNYINKNPDNAKKLMNSEIKKLTNKSLPVDVLDSSFKRIIVTYNPEREAINELVILSVESGFLRKRPDTKKLFNLNYPK